MARQFNGTSSDFGISAANIDLTAANVVTVATWLWWDAFSADGKFAWEHNTSSHANGGLWSEPDYATSTDWRHLMRTLDGSTYSYGIFPRPSAAWHHIIVTYDISVNPNVISVWHDNVAQTASSSSWDTISSGHFPSALLNIMRNGSGSVYGAGRMAAYGLWSRALTSTERANLLAGTLPTAITTGLVASWRMSAAGATEADASGNGHTLNYTGTTIVTDPSQLAPPVSVLRPVRMAAMRAATR